MHYRVTRWLKFTKKSQKLFFPAINWSKCTIVPENGGTPTFPHVFQIFRPRSLYHIPNVIIPTLIFRRWCISDKNFTVHFSKVWNFLDYYSWKWRLKITLTVKVVLQNAPPSCSNICTLFWCSAFGNCKNCLYQVIVVMPRRYSFT